MSQESGHPAVSQEAYPIGISSDGTMLIGILSPEGGLCALETLVQRFYAHSGSEKDVYTPCAPLVVKDAPAFEHGGLNLDISRNLIPPQDALRIIEAMGFNKLNKLHLHATNAQPWPLEIPALPELAKEGAYRKEQIWTTKDLEEVQRHGLYHGVEVYLEIDLPGHTASIFHSHPDLVTAYSKPWATYAMEPPSGQLKMNSPDVPPLLIALFNDLLPRSSPFSSHFHVGDDQIKQRSIQPGPHSQILLRKSPQASSSKTHRIRAFIGQEPFFNNHCLRRHAPRMGPQISRLHCSPNLAL